MYTADDVLNVIIEYTNSLIIKQYDTNTHRFSFNYNSIIYLDDKIYIANVRGYDCLFDYSDGLRIKNDFTDVMQYYLFDGIQG
jgi:hypothetical protein